MDSLIRLFRCRFGVLDILWSEKDRGHNLFIFLEFSVVLGTIGFDIPLGWLPSYLCIFFKKIVLVNHLQKVVLENLYWPMMFILWSFPRFLCTSCANDNEPFGPDLSKIQKMLSLTLLAWHTLPSPSHDKRPPSWMSHHKDLLLQGFWSLRKYYENAYTIIGCLRKRCKSSVVLDLQAFI